jgi:hypothetical protein
MVLNRGEFRAAVKQSARRLIGHNPELIYICQQHFEIRIQLNTQTCYCSLSQSTPLVSIVIPFFFSIILYF